MSKFVYSVCVKFRGGRGGNGCISMMSLFANEFAGPDGGNGGHGGHVVLQANKEVKSLNNVAKLYHGKHGTPGMGKNMFGANGEHTFVHVPVGTLVLPAKPRDLSEIHFDPDESEIIAELDQHGSMFMAARGGSGGHGNAYFLSDKNRHPMIAEAGAVGEENAYELRMRVFAHIGLIGAPNVGKSTLLNTLTGARVVVANYAFTTKDPHVGVIEFDDYTQVAVADLPGLIRDSHINRGLGLKFLRSLQHCACLLYVIDLSHRPVEQFETLVNELDQFKKDMSWRPHIVLANKIDQEGSLDNLAKFTQYLAQCRPRTKVVVGSGKRGDGLAELRQELRRLHDEYQAKNSDALEPGLIW